MILFLQILGVSSSVVAGLWMLSVFATSILPNRGPVLMGNFMIAVVLISLTIWQLVAYGWIAA